MFDGLTMDLGTLARLSDAETRSISAENVDGAKGKGGMATEGLGLKAARDLGGRPWKVAPAVEIKPGKVYEVADIEGPGAIQQFWMTPSGNWRYGILRIYWDGEETPSVECPVGDFFCMGWGAYAQVTSLPVVVNPGSAFNSYWVMPFRKRCRMTFENLADEPMFLFYQVNYTLADVPDHAGYFHAQFRRSNPLPYKEVHTILDGVRGWGHYAGTYMAWGVNNDGWWGEGEIKFHLDGDGEFPTICGTGTEDYFCGSYNFEPDWQQKGFHGNYQEFTTAYAGLPQVIRPEGTFKAQTRFGLYRWHVMDPVRFAQDLRVTIQALGWRSGGRYLPLQDDIASTAFWYQREPHAPFPKLPCRDLLEVI
jgi:hypothetical protein